MRKLAQFGAMGLEVVPWSVPNIGNATTKDGRRFRFARRSKKSDLALGRASFEDWQKHVKTAAEAARADLPTHLGPIRLCIEFFARTPKGRRDGELWAVGLNWNAAAGKWTKRSHRGRPEPDLTNMFKGTEDAIASVYYADDVQVRMTAAVALYGPTDGVRVTVYAIEPGDFPGRGEPAA